MNENAKEIITDLINAEKDEQKKYQLLQLKSLFDFVPIQSHEVKEPIDKEAIRNTIRTNLKM
jgi:hypothetical protein